MDVRQSPFGTLSAANMKPGKYTITVTPRAELERRVALHQQSRQPDDPPEQWTPMPMEKYLSTLADRMEGVAKREGSGGLLKTAEDLRQKAADVAAHGTTVDPLMVLILQQVLFQEGGTYGPPGTHPKGWVPETDGTQAAASPAEPTMDSVEPEAVEDEAIPELASPNFVPSKLSELDPWLRDEHAA